MCVQESKSLFVVSLELPENWTDTRETLLEGMLFSLKYMGMTLVEQPKGEELSAAAVKRIVATVSVRAGAESCLLLFRRVCHWGGFQKPQVWRQRCPSGDVGSAGPAVPGVSRHWVVWGKMQAAALGSPWGQPQPADGALCGKLVCCVSELWLFLISLGDPGCGRRH